MRILRVERPLAVNDLNNKKRVEVFNMIKEYVVSLASSLSYDFVEMELYDLIDGEVFFPSSLSTVGTFNLPQDYAYLKDPSFEEVKTTICFEVLKENYHVNRGRSGFFNKWRRQTDRWSVADQKSDDIEELYMRLVIPLFAFNLPEYVLSRKEPKPASVKWFPDLFLLSKDNWRFIVGDKDEVHRRVFSINRGKIYRISGLSMDDFLSQIHDIWETKPLSNLSRLQIFSDVRYRDMICDAGGRVVHELRLIRKKMH